MTNGWLAVLGVSSEEGCRSVGVDVKRDWPRSGIEIFAFVPSSTPAPRGFVPGNLCVVLNVSLNLPGADVVRRVYTHAYKDTQ